MARTFMIKDEIKARLTSILTFTDNCSVVVDFYNVLLTDARGLCASG